ncbi:MAG TPA: hypothetical protein VF612_14555 [Jatrophihabitans sp.]|uniref:hypothetical protein n=1 Tax=Jatrophihabitans sp. TaxID=1932789 RepID=UPI002EDBCD0B
MRLVQLSVGARPPAEGLPAGTDRHAATDAAGVDAALAEAWPGRLGAQAPRLVIDADLAGLNLVLHRLLRRGLLETVETAVLLREPVPYLSRLGLPADLDGQLRVARQGAARLVGVVKDDSGGVCVDGASLEPWPGEEARWWLRAVVDDQRLADGTARGLRVRRLGPSELEATVQLGRLRRRTCRGRSLQLACDPALIVADGVARERPRGKRTFWSEPALWRLALPAG